MISEETGKKIMDFLIQNWWIVFFGGGAFMLLGAIFRWKLVCDPQGENTMGFNAFVYRTFGEKGYRVLNGLFGVALIGIGVVFGMIN